MIFNYDPECRHRHNLIRYYTKHCKILFNCPIKVIETGCIRTNIDEGDGHSTTAINAELDKKDKFYSVDIRSNHLRICMDVVGKKQNQFYIFSESIEYFRSLPEKPIFHFCYLDSKEDTEHGFFEFLEAVSRTYDNGMILIDNAGTQTCIDGKKGLKIQSFLNNRGIDFYKYFKMDHGGMMGIRVTKELKDLCKTRLLIGG